MAYWLFFASPDKSDIRLEIRNAFSPELPHPYVRVNYWHIYNNAGVSKMQPDDTFFVWKLRGSEKTAGIIGRGRILIVKPDADDLYSPKRIDEILNQKGLKVQFKDETKIQQHLEKYPAVVVEYTDFFEQPLAKENLRNLPEFSGVFEHFVYQRSATRLSDDMGKAIERALEQKSSRSTSVSNRGLQERQRIERIAIQETRDYFKEREYHVVSVELDDAGWDLNAVKGGEFLRLEVKGLSGSTVSVELTPNEYEKMLECRETYKICVVTDALNNPALKVFSFSSETYQWSDQYGKRLNVEERTGARLRA